MANKILTPSIIAKEALMVLRNNAVMANLVYRDYSNDFAAVGDTITIRKPATFKANEYNGSIEVQDATETGVKVVMNKLLDVSFAVTSKEMTLDISDFSNQLIVPAMQAFADKIDSSILALNSMFAAVSSSFVARFSDISSSVTSFYHFFLFTHFLFSFHIYEFQ